MQVAQLGGFFEITQYKLCSQSAVLELVEGEIRVRAQYAFFNAAGQQRGPVVNVRMSVTSQQSSDLLAILAQVLQATNAEIASQTGWTKYTEGESV